MSELAIAGGTPVRTKPFHGWPVQDESEIEAVAELARSGQWWHSHHGSALGSDSPEARASKVARFQRAFAEYHQAAYGIACANGSAALEIALRALGVKPGDEVIVPCYTFIATANAVLHMGAVPIFADIDPRTYCLDPRRIEAAITRRTVGIVPVHFGGQPASMDKINKIADKHGLFVLEDAAHAHGARRGGRFAGTLGHAGTFSFQKSKNMTAGEGGAILTNDRLLAEIVESLVWAGRKAGGGFYDFYRLGWNYRMTEWQGAVLLCQLARLKQQTARRDANAMYLESKLRELPCIRPMKRLRKTEVDSRHLFMLRFDEAKAGVSRELFLKALDAEGVRVSPGYKAPLFENALYLKQKHYSFDGGLAKARKPRRIDYASFRETCPAARRACDSEAMWIAQYVLLGTIEDMNDIFLAFEKIWENIDALRAMKAAGK